MKVSMIIPCFNAHATLADTLQSIFNPRGGIPADVVIEAIVIDDCSSNPDVLANIVADYRGAVLLRHEQNRGTAAARNTGIAYSSGDVLIMLDADDFFLPTWLTSLTKIMLEWPDDCMACFSECRTHEGYFTSESSGYQGRVDIKGFLSEKIFGEYLPLFRGEFIRENLYIDLGQRRGCEIVTYVNMAKLTSFWVTPIVLRVYRFQDLSSENANWASPATARELVVCYTYLLSVFKAEYRQHAPKSFQRRQLRLAVYRRLAHQSGYWRDWLHGVGFRVFVDSISSFFLICFGPHFIRHTVPIAKKLRLVRRFG